MFLEHREEMQRLAFMPLIPPAGVRHWANLFKCCSGGIGAARRVGVPNKSRSWWRGKINGWNPTSWRCLPCLVQMNFLFNWVILWFELLMFRGVQKGLEYHLDGFPGCQWGNKTRSLCLRMKLWLVMKGVWKQKECNVVNIQSWIHEQVILNYNQGAQLFNLLIFFLARLSKQTTCITPVWKSILKAWQDTACLAIRDVPSRCPPFSSQNRSPRAQQPGG